MNLCPPINLSIPMNLWIPMNLCAWNLWILVKAYPHRWKAWINGVNTYPQKSLHHHQNSIKITQILIINLLQYNSMESKRTQIKVGLEMGAPVRNLCNNLLLGILDLYLRVHIWQGTTKAKKLNKKILCLRIGKNRGKVNSLSLGFPIKMDAFLLKDYILNNLEVGPLMDWGLLATKDSIISMPERIYTDF